MPRGPLPSSPGTALFYTPPVTIPDPARTITVAAEALAAAAKPITVSSLLEELGVGQGFSLDEHGAADADGPETGPDVRFHARYRLRGELGRGGMGAVFEALDPDLGRAVALKVVLDPANVTPQQLARFVAEARATGQLQHPNIVPVYGLGVTDAGQVFYAMKKVGGRTLQEILDAREAGDPETVARWTLPRLLQAFIQVCNAIAYAHSRRVLHRDLKPANILFGPFGEVLVMDWGLVRRLDGDDEPQDSTTRPAAPEAVPESSQPEFVMPTLARTADGAMMGTPGYMSPEQARGDVGALDGRADQWSLGAILYEILTGERAYVAPDLYALIFRTLAGPPDDPRERAPTRRIDEELAGLCMRTLAAEPDDRFPAVADLADAVQAWLDGSRRRAAAAAHVIAARRAWAGYLAARDEHARLTEAEEDLRQRIKPWLPVEEKSTLIDCQNRLEELVAELVDRFEAAVAECEQAQSQDPGNDGAAALLADIHYARFEEAESEGDPVRMRHHRRRVLRHDDGRYADLLHGTGRLTLRTDPPGAEVLARPVHKVGLVWPLGEAAPLGRTPLDGVPLEMGSWILTLRADGRRDTTYPVLIERGAHWAAGEPVRLLRDADIGPDWVYVPRGPFVAGGDAEAWGSEPRALRQVDGFLMSRHPVTMAEWAEYLSWLHGEDPEAAWLAVPRVRNTGQGGDLGQMWDRPPPGGRYEVPEIDHDGDPWDPRWPVCAISWRDVQGFLAWRGSARRPVRLPTEDEWEKAARGVDGRFLPWGDRFDSSLCAMLTSRPGPARPEPVGGRPADRSVYGVQDLAGCIRTLCGDPSFGGKPTLRAIRGGAYSYDERNCRLAWRNGVELDRVAPTVGFRLARDLPGR